MKQKREIKTGITRDEGIDYAKTLARRIRELSDGKRLNRRFVPEYKLQILPGLFSSDIHYKMFMDNLIRRLREKEQPNEVENGLFKNIPNVTNVDKLRTDPASIRVPLHFGRNRFTVPLSLEEDKLLKQVVNILTRSFKDNPGRITRDSSSGFPLFTNNLEVKQKHLEFIVENLDVFMDTFKRRQRDKMLSEFKVINVADTQIRKQHDSWKQGKPKFRDIIPFDVAFFGDGRNLTKDEIESLSITGGVATCRTRVVCAMPGVINNLLTGVFEGFKKYMFSEYEETFTHRGGENIVAKLKNFKNFVGVDITAFDSNAPENVIVRIIELLPLTDECKDLIFDLLYCPWYCSDADGFGTKMISQNPFDNDYRTFKGMPSGIFFTTFINCVQVFFYKLVEYSRFRTAGLSFSDEEIIEILKHRADIGFLIMSDDGIDCFKTDAVFNEIIQKGFVNRFVDFEREEEISFGGFQFYKKENGIGFCHNILSYFEHLYLPEKGLNSFYRRRPIEGMLLRREIYADHPLFNDYLKIEADAYYETFRSNLTDDIMRWKAFDQRDNGRFLFEIEHLTNKEKELIASPNKIHYKIEEEEVRPEVLEIISASIDVRLVNILRGRFIK